MNPSFTASILVVEDDPQQLKLYSQALTGYRLTCVSNVTSAILVLHSDLPDVILLDHVLEGGELGAKLLPRIKQIAAHVPVIIISGTLGLEEQIEALQGPDHAAYVLKKPVQLQKLRDTVKLALDECGFGEMVRSMRSLERAEHIATSDRERLFTERSADFRAHPARERTQESNATTRRKHVVDRSVHVGIGDVPIGRDHKRVVRLMVVVTERPARQA